MTGAIRYFMTGFLLTWSIALGAAIALEKGLETIYFSQLRTPELNWVAKYGTWLGDGVLLAILALVLLFFVSVQKGALLAIIGVAQALIAALFKQVIFNGWPRPSVFLADRPDLIWVEGVALYGYNSFPSGHTLTAFSLAAFIVLMWPRRRYVIPLLSYAWFIAFTRVYLGQHFLQDVVFGAALGLAVTAAVVFLLRKKFPLWNHKGLISIRLEKKKNQL